MANVTLRLQEIAIYGEGRGSIVTCICKLSIWDGYSEWLVKYLSAINMVIDMRCQSLS